MLKDLFYQDIVLDGKGKGQILTPETIVDYMAAESIKEALKIKEEGKPLMIIDPACGTGRFMLGVAEYCFTNQIPFVFWNIDIDERMTDATKKHAEHYKIPAIVILGDALLNDFKKAWQIIDGVAKEIDVNPLIEGFKRLSEKNKDGK